MSVPATLDSFFRRVAPADPGDTILVAFSGGPDSTALLLGLRELATRRDLRLVAAHLDHGADPGSPARALAATRLARELGVPCVTARREVAAFARAAGWGDGLEAAGRRVRYRFLEEVRRARAARWIATAHHRDDQAETVALRLLHGSGMEGLAGIQPRRGRIVRPLLALPRAALRAAVEAAGLEPLDDPTNRDPRLARNRVRHRVLPALEASEPGAGDALARLAAAAHGARAALEGRLAAHLRPAAVTGGVAVSRGALEALPDPLLPHALALLHRHAGADHPPGRAARAELLRQLAVGEARAGGAGCDLADGWRWEATRSRLTLLRPPEATPSFAYTLRVPGTLEVPELGLALSVRRQPVASWMFEGSRRRAGLALPLAPGDRVTVRNRRPGDRLHPLGAPGSRKLKDLLIDRRVPRRERDRLPLLCVGDRIAWIAGVTVDEAYRLSDDRRAAGGTCWTVEVIP